MDTKKEEVMDKYKNSDTVGKILYIFLINVMFIIFL